MPKPVTDLSLSAFVKILLVSGLVLLSSCAQPARNDTSYRVSQLKSVVSFQQSEDLDAGGGLRYWRENRKKNRRIGTGAGISVQYWPTDKEADLVPIQVISGLSVNQKLGQNADGRANELFLRTGPGAAVAPFSGSDVDQKGRDRNLDSWLFWEASVGYRSQKNMSAELSIQFNRESDSGLVTDPTIFFSIGLYTDLETGDWAHDR